MIRLLKLSLLTLALASVLSTSSLGDGLSRASAPKNGPDPIPCPPCGGVINLK